MTDKKRDFYLVTPASDTSTHSGLIEPGTTEAQAQVLATAMDMDAGQHALILGCLRMAQLAGPSAPTMKALMANVDFCERAVLEAVTLHRSVYEPLRAGSLLPMLLERFNIPGDEITLLRAEHQHGSYDQPANPWTLLHEGESESAVPALLTLLRWDASCQSEARAVLKHWA